MTQSQAALQAPPSAGGIQAVPIEVAPGTGAEAARRFLANRLAVIGLVVALLIIAVAALADVLAPYPRDFADFGAVLQYPNAAHPLGTDAVGRDFLSRVLHGARTSMMVGLLTPLFSAFIGIPLGAWAGWHGGKFDFVFLRMVEITTAIPGYMLAILLVTVWGGGLELLIIYFVLVGWVGFGRLARAQFVALKPREYVLSARSLGASEFRLMLRHILPNAAGPIVVILVIAIPEAIFSEAGLSVLGLGVKNPIPSWGKMIAEGAPYASTYWYLMVVPTVLIAITMLAFTFVGDGMRDALDPHSQQSRPRFLKRGGLQMAHKS
jgi:ABC-type dipeptide/oligopeptide/nickel transport system permease subunit